MNNLAEDPAHDDERELGTERLSILPTTIVRIGTQARIPLSDVVNVVVIFFEVLEPATDSHRPAIRNLEPPVNRERCFLSRLEWLWQMQTHHRPHDAVLHFLAILITHTGDLEAAIELLSIQNRPQSVIGKPLQIRRRR